MIVTLSVLGLSILLFIRGKIRADLVALCGLVIFMVAGILTPDEALSGFSNPVVIMMIGLFIVGGGVLQTGLADMISKRLVMLAGDSHWKVYLLVMLVTAGIGGFVSNTGTVALMLPIVVSMAVSSGMSPSRLLMPVAFASSMGGMMTLIGTPPNLVISNELVKAGYPELSFFVFSKVGLIIIIVGVAALWFLSKKFLNKTEEKSGNRGRTKSLEDLAREYHLYDNRHVFYIGAHSPLAGQSIKSLDIAEKYRVIVVEIAQRIDRRLMFSKTVQQTLASPDTIFQGGDRLAISGKEEDVRKFAETFNLKHVLNPDRATKIESGFDFENIGIAEVVVLSNSRLVNKTVQDTGFRENYQINVLGIQRNNQYILHNLKDEKILAGDALLVQGGWKNIARLDSHMTGLVIIGQPLAEASKVRLDYKAPIAAIIMLGMVISMVFNLLPVVTAVMLAGILMIFTGCLRNVEAAFQTINWESALLIAAMIPMATALEKTGVSNWVAVNLAETLGGLGPIYLLAGIYLATSTLTLFINNTATAVLFAPIALQIALGMGVSPYPFLFAVTIAASMSFASPFSTAPNALVMSAGRYTFVDYLRVGLPLQLLFFILMTILLPLIFPF